MDPEYRKAKGQTVSLDDQVSTWAPPAAQRFEAADLDRMLARQAECKAKGKSGNGFGLTLDNQVQIWPTPRARDPEKAGPNMRGSKGDIPLPAHALNWPSPTARIHKGGGRAVTRQDGKSRLDMLDMLDWAAEAWSASPSSPRGPATIVGLTSSGQRLNFYLRTRATTNTALRSEMRSLLRIGIKETGGKGWTRRNAAPFVRPSFRKRLNPLFVEWLMGWPIGWTGSAPVETASSHWWQAMRGELSRLVSRKPAQADLFGAVA